ncbi:MAG: phage tail protein [Bryobacteraceae bacterium]
MRVLKPIAPLAIAVDCRAIDDDIWVIHERHVCDVRLIPGVIRPEFRETIYSHRIIGRRVVVFEHRVTAAEIQNRPLRDRIDEVSGNVSRVHNAAVVIGHRARIVRRVVALVERGSELRISPKYLDFVGDVPVGAAGEVRVFHRPGIRRLEVVGTGQIVAGVVRAPEILHDARGGRVDPV